MQSQPACCNHCSLDCGEGAVLLRLCVTTGVKLTMSAAAAAAATAALVLRLPPQYAGAAGAAAKHL
jgi:hypothetical protein